MTYRQVWLRLTPLYAESEAKAIARWLLESRFRLSLTDIYCGGLERLSASELLALEQAICRLEKGEPVQYVVEQTTFCGREFHVEPGVLIPRPETEELCRWIVEDNAECDEVVNTVLDIGTGSGCIAITLAAELPKTRVTAWDISVEALRIAQENAQHHSVDITLEKRDALNLQWSKEEDGKLLDNGYCLLDNGYCPEVWSIIVSNPPYIDEATERNSMAKNVLDYEPYEALFAPQNQPDIFYRCIGDYAIYSLQPGGRLYFELNPLTAEIVSNYLLSLGFRNIEIRNDQFGRQRMLKAIKP